MIKAVIFDIDDTLTIENSWQFLAVQLGGDPEEERENYRDYEQCRKTEEEAFKFVVQLWQSKRLATKLMFQKIFLSINLRPGALGLIDFLKQKNKIPCLITGSMDMYAKIIAEKLRIKDYYYNADLIWDNRDYITGFDYTSDQAELKLRQFYEFCKKHNLMPEECAVVGDSQNDYLLFQETKKGIAIRTPHEDKSLEEVAWKIVDNLLQIKDIII